MKSVDQSRRLAQAMVDTGKRMGTRIVALITDMNEPLGLKIGNSLEVEESLDTLRGEGPEDLTSLCRTLTAYMLLLGKAVGSIEEGELRYDRVISSGEALATFRRIIEAQGGDPLVIDNYSRLPQAAHRLPIVASERGHVAGMDAANIGLASVILGAGRQTVDSKIDPAVGIVMAKKVGDPVERGEVLCTLLYNSDAGVEEATRLCRSAVAISPTSVAPKTLVKEIIQ